MNDITGLKIISASLPLLHLKKLKCSFWFQIQLGFILSFEPASHVQKMSDLGENSPKIATFWQSKNREYLSNKTL
jgi:hypothetical protein